MDRAIQRAIAHWTQLLDLDGFVVPFEFVWRDDLDSNTLMQSIVTGRDFRSWNSVRTKLDESMLGEDVDGWEEAAYVDLPTGSQIQHAWPGGTSNTSRIMLPASFLNKWFGVTAGDPCRIEMNSVAIAWDIAVGSECGSYGQAELSGDTVVDILDFLEFLDAFSSGC